jgi:predicted MFS family arabinose efflux permease
LPLGPASVLAALHLSAPATEPLARLSDAEWRTTLDYCDRSRLTLALGQAARAALPAWVAERIDDNARKAAIRADRTGELYCALQRHFTGGGIEFVLLKGLTHTALVPDPPPRVQYDVDLYIPRPDVFRARDVLIGEGWQPIEGMESFPTDHLPALLPQSEQKWRGDFFDTELPLAVELHFQFWNPAIERLPAPGTEEFWERRTRRTIAGIELGVLSPPDAIGYAALHLLKHLLRGSVQPFHVYEIARLLDSLADDDAFWREWTGLHSPETRRLEAVVFRLAQAWFGGRTAQAVQQEVELLPAGTEEWFGRYAVSPASRVFHPNKDELWLHFTLLGSRADCWRVARRRLFPANLPPRLGWYAFRRLYHHVLSLPRAIFTGISWRWRGRGLGDQFWWFIAAAAIFNFGLFIFFLLYNLFLLDLGFREDFVGTVSAAMRAGGVAGTLPAALVAHRFGLRTALLATIGATAAAEVLRAVVGARLPLAGLAFVSGAVFAVWAVILAPLIAASVPKQRRPAAFSVFFACMFAVGIAGNWIGGRLPLWMGSKRAVLLAAAAFLAVAILPALKLRELPMPPAGARVWPRSRFLALYLAPFALWHLATGTFNPFNNVYFARLGFAVQRIGSIFSASQLVQVAALLAAPAIIRRLGLLGGIVTMMAATAVGLGALASQPPGAGAVAAYMAYMAFQWMSEPGLNTLLMNHIDERERSGASALNYLVAFGAQALAAFTAGNLFARLGYRWTLAGAAALAAAAALLFRLLLRDGEPPPHHSDSGPA